MTPSQRKNISEPADWWPAKEGASMNVILRKTHCGKLHEFFSYDRGTTVEVWHGSRHAAGSELVGYAVSDRTARTMADLWFQEQVMGVSVGVISLED